MALAATVETAPRVSSWIDSDTPSEALTKVIDGEMLTLEFSDEFADADRDFRVGMDAKWEALRYGSNRTSCHRPEGVTVQNGRAVFVYESNYTQDLNNWEYAFGSAMLQGWNKFCYTGGYVEVCVSVSECMCGLSGVVCIPHPPPTNTITDPPHPRVKDPLLKRRYVPAPGSTHRHTHSSLMAPPPPSPQTWAPICVILPLSHAQPQP